MPAEPCKSIGSMDTLRTITLFWGVDLQRLHEMSCSVWRHARIHAGCREAKTYEAAPATVAHSRLDLSPLPLRRISRPVGLMAAALMDPFPVLRKLYQNMQIYAELRKSRSLQMPVLVLEVKCAGIHAASHQIHLSFQTSLLHIIALCNSTMFSGSIS